MEALNRLINILKKFPGIGKKSARRIAYYLLRQEGDYLSEIGTLIAGLKNNLCTCGHCGNISESNPCSICSDPLRDRKTLCIVDDAESLAALEESGLYSGLYHILGRVSPLGGEDLSDETAEFLLRHIHELEADEVIIATNPKLEGDMAYYTLLDVLKNAGVENVTRLAYGLPVGGSIEFADRATLSTAIASRTKVM
ncbi:MAG: recombination protein RecR [Synergistaceae bacterium]|nr:recombination protein RecR [Synergistaceae bacterium]